MSTFKALVVTKPDTGTLPIVVELLVDRDTAPLLVADGWLCPEGSDVVLRGVGASGSGRGRAGGRRLGRGTGLGTRG